MAFGFLIVTIFTSIQAQAALKICNESGTPRDVAIGYKDDGKWVSEGWWKLKERACKTVIKSELSKTYYYYRAKHKGGDFAGDGYKFCTSDEPFTIIGDDHCKSRGYYREDFKELKLAKGTTGFTLTLDTSISDNNEDAKNRTPAKISRETPKQQSVPAVNYDKPIGTHGEPYSITGIFKGCRRVDGLLSCEVVADGWRYVAYEDGRNNPATLKKLDVTAANQRLRIAGDMISQGDVSADVTIREFEVLAGNSTLLAELIGLWESRDDATYTVRFTDEARKYAYLDGNLATNEAVEFTRTCDDPSVGVKEITMLQAVNEIDRTASLCYEIVEVSEKSLTLMYLPRGNMLVFKKIGN